jgi:hypothetical protein
MTPERAKARDEFRDHGNKITNSTGRPHPNSGHCADSGENAD